MDFDCLFEASLSKDADLVSLLSRLAAGLEVNDEYMQTRSFEAVNAHVRAVARDDVSTCLVRACRDVVLACEDDHLLCASMDSLLLDTRLWQNVSAAVHFSVLDSLEAVAAKKANITRTNFSVRKVASLLNTVYCLPPPEKANESWPASSLRRRLASILPPSLCSTPETRYIVPLLNTVVSLEDEAQQIQQLCTVCELVSRFVSLPLPEPTPALPTLEPLDESSTSPPDGVSPLLVSATEEASAASPTSHSRSKSGSTKMSLLKRVVRSATRKSLAHPVRPLPDEEGSRVNRRSSTVFLKDSYDKLEVEELAQILFVLYRLLRHPSKSVQCLSLKTAVLAISGCKVDDNTKSSLLLSLGHFVCTPAWPSTAGQINVSEPLYCALIDLLVNKSATLPVELQQKHVDVMFNNTVETPGVLWLLAAAMATLPLLDEWPLKILKDLNVLVLRSHTNAAVWDSSLCGPYIMHVPFDLDGGQEMTRLATNALRMVCVAALLRPDPEPAGLVADCAPSPLLSPTGSPLSPPGGGGGGGGGGASGGGGGGGVPGGGSGTIGTGWFATKGYLTLLRQCLGKNKANDVEALFSGFMVDLINALTKTALSHLDSSASWFWVNIVGFVVWCEVLLYCDDTAHEYVSAAVHPSRVSWLLPLLKLFQAGSFFGIDAFEPADVPTDHMRAGGYTRIAVRLLRSSAEAQGSAKDSNAVAEIVSDLVAAVRVDSKRFKLTHFHLLLLLGLVSDEKREALLPLATLTAGHKHVSDKIPAAVVQGGNTEWFDTPAWRDQADKYLAPKARVASASYAADEAKFLSSHQVWADGVVADLYALHRGITQAAATFYSAASSMTPSATDPIKNKVLAIAFGSQWNVKFRCPAALDMQCFLCPHVNRSSHIAYCTTMVCKAETSVLHSCILHERDRWDTSIKSLRFVNSDQTGQVAHMECASGFPLVKDRDFVLRCEVTQLTTPSCRNSSGDAAPLVIKPQYHRLLPKLLSSADSASLLITFVSESNAFPENDECVRGEVSYSGFVLTPGETPDTTRLIYVLDCDLKGRFPAMLRDRYVTNRLTALATLRALAESVSSTGRCSRRVAVDDTDPMCGTRTSRRPAVEDDTRGCESAALS